MTGGKIILSLLGNGMPGLTPACGMMLAESAAVCLEDRDHQVGVKPAFQVKNTHYISFWQAKAFGR
jgi:hypothetical protein